MEELLKDLGLSQKEAKVYLACLELNKDTVYQISAKAGIKRPTTYLVLKDLAAKGLVAMSQTQKATVYSAAHPRKLMTILRHRERELEEGLVNLESLYNINTAKPQIKTFEGIKSVEELYDEITDYAGTKGKEVLAFGTTEFLQQIHKAQYKYWLRQIKNKKCHIREILNSDKHNQKYLEILKKNQNPNHQVGMIKEGMEFFKTDSLIYGNKVALFSSVRDFFVIVIESEAMVQSFRAFFELGWQSAKKMK